jgi:hypothetical protein
LTVSFRLALGPSQRLGIGREVIVESHCEILRHATVVARLHRADSTPVAPRSVLLFGA